MGRANEAAIRITDISVSRLHASITYSNGSFYVKDEQAKFGTLIYLREPLAIPLNSSKSVRSSLGTNKLKEAFNVTLQLGRF